jgi:hypothetical protein
MKIHNAATIIDEIKPNIVFEYVLTAYSARTANIITKLNPPIIFQVVLPEDE